MEIISTVFASVVLYIVTVYWALVSQWYLWLIFGVIYLVMRFSFEKRNTPFRPSENWADFWKLTFWIALIIVVLYSTYSSLTA